MIPWGPHVRASSPSEKSRTARVEGGCSSSSILALPFSPEAKSEVRYCSWDYRQRTNPHRHNAVLIFFPSGNGQTIASRVVGQIRDQLVLLPHVIQDAAVDGYDIGVSTEDLNLLKSRNHELIASCSQEMRYVFASIVIRVVSTARVPVMAGSPATVDFLDKMLGLSPLVIVIEKPGERLELGFPRTTKVVVIKDKLNVHTEVVWLLKASFPGLGEPGFLKDRMGCPYCVRIPGENPSHAKGREWLEAPRDGEGSYETEEEARAEPSAQAVVEEVE